ncbi:MAG TPA: cupin domain-containing protein [Candidatus Kapabacteria bacterium]|nr:cupin domain-containing protein [Candidatus Kapabacteria bacterium]
MADTTLVNDNEALVQRYIAGEMTPDEEVAFERSLASNAELANEVSSGLQTLSAMYDRLAATAPAPRRNLKGKVLARVAEEDAPSPYNDLDYILTQDESPWIPTVVQGISYRMLYADEDGRVMVIAKLEPGAIYPDHPHRGTEECYVLTGDLQISGHSLKGGDFIAAREGAEHDHVYSNEGCELLLKLPIPYELFPPQ